MLVLDCVLNVRDECFKVNRSHKEYIVLMAGEETESRDKLLLDEI